MKYAAVIAVKKGDLEKEARQLGGMESREDIKFAV